MPEEAARKQTTHHDTVIAEGDHVILFVADKRAVRAVEKLFQLGIGFF